MKTKARENSDHSSDIRYLALLFANRKYNLAKSDAARYNFSEQDIRQASDMALNEFHNFCNEEFTLKIASDIKRNSEIIQKEIKEGPLVLIDNNGRYSRFPLLR